MMLISLLSILSSCDRTKQMFRSAGCCTNTSSALHSTFSQKAVFPPDNPAVNTFTTIGRTLLGVETDGSFPFNYTSLYSSVAAAGDLAVALNKDIAINKTAIVTEQTISLYGSDIRCHILTPLASDDAEPFPVILWARSLGIGIQASFYVTLMTALVHQTRAVVILPQYTDWMLDDDQTLSTAYSYEMEELVEWVASHSTSLNVDASKIVVGGDSFGAFVWTRALLNTALPIKLMISVSGGLGSDDHAILPPGASQEYYYEPPDFFRWFSETWAPLPESIREPYLTVSDADLMSHPPLLKIVGEYDLLASAQIEHASRLMALGVDVTTLFMKGAPHNFILASNFFPKETQYFIDAVDIMMRRLL